MRKLTFSALVCCMTLLSQQAFAGEWSLTKPIRATQSQKVGQALYIWTDGSWFEQSHKCSEKTVILITPHGSGSYQDAYDQIYSQVLMAHASGKPVQFGINVDDCEASVQNAYFRADFIRVFNNN